MIKLDFEIPLVDGLRVIASGDPESPLLDRFMQGYDRAFVLPNEREEREGFVACLEMNGKDNASDAGKFIELVSVFENQDGELVAGANFLLSVSDANPDFACISLNYAFVEKEFRGKGIARVIFAKIRELCNQFMQNSRLKYLFFFEHNDPLKMSREEYEIDSSHSGIDQLDRLKMSSRLGGRIIDFPYVQPSLSEDKEPDDTLIYVILGDVEDSIDSNLLNFQLRSFFGISVLKGSDISLCSVSQSQLDFVSERETVSLLRMDTAIDRARSLNFSADFSSFRDFARSVVTSEV